VSGGEWKNPVTIVAALAGSIQFERPAQSGTKRILRPCAPDVEVTMSEVEFDRLLDVVRTAVAPVPGEDFMLARLTISTAVPRADNDNGAAWPLIPFPDGWNAAC
jgi:hypothetical protein